MNKYNIEKEEKHFHAGRFIALGIVFILLVITLFNSYVIIPTGFTGVRSVFGQINEQSFNPGFNWKIPYVERVQKVNNKQQNLDIKSQIWSETSERTAIYYEGLTITYTINPEYSSWIISHVSNYKNALITSEIVASAIKTAAKQLNSIDATNRSMIESLAQEALQTMLNDKYDVPCVTIDKITISNADFEETYNQAIAAKQNEQIAYEQQQIANKLALEKAEADANIARTEAQGRADSQLITAQANADAEIIKAKAETEANQMLSDSLTDKILEKLYYDTWDGKLPAVVGESAANDTTPIYMVPEQ